MEHPPRPARARLVGTRGAGLSELAFELATYQTYARDAHVNVYELADLSRALSLFGNRAYRVDGNRLTLLMNH